MNDTAPVPARAPKPEPAPAASEAPAAAVSKTDDLIERWWNDHFPGSPVAMLTTAWNHAFAAKEELKRRLNAL